MAKKISKCLKKYGLVGYILKKKHQLKKKQKKLKQNHLKNKIHLKIKS